ncbi:MAG: YibE/F family protein [Candidatus Levybacteria bacterium]|nr:YibE/F family protein [Candidatus Levybacteria bacterium]
MKIIKVVLSLAFLFFLLPQITLAQAPPKDERFEAVVVKVQEEKQIEINGKKQLYQKLELRITSEDSKGKIVIIENGKIPQVKVQEFKAGDKLVITKSKDEEGKDVYLIADFIRRDSLYILFAIFVGLVIFIGRKRGILSILGMIISFFIIFTFILPQIMQGRDPILITVTASFIIIPLTFYLSHGLNMKTTSAVLGTLIALIITGILANVFVDATRLTGFASEEAGFLEMMRQGAFNMKALLLSGIIIGVLGILDDITVSQAAIVYQLKETSPKLPIQELYSRAMDVGKDHIASMVNTLVLVYTGAAMPLLLLFINNKSPFGQVINFEIIAEEIVRTLVASTGLILAVPITTFITALIVYNKIKL